jgi:hypothetical protein
VSSQGFQVFLADLLSGADVFQEQSGVLGKIIPPGGPACPDGGSPDVDQAMRAAAQVLASLQSQLGTAVDQHATRLRGAYDKYAKTDANLASLAYEITNPGTV